MTAKPPKRAVHPKEQLRNQTRTTSPASLSNISASILEDYDKKHELHDQLRDKCEQLIREILGAENIRVHSVSGRVKERRKLEEKLRAPGKNYACLDQVTDTVGLRIITYFDDEVDAVARIIKREFELDEPNCVDKRKSLEPDQFGYLSLHYVCKISPERLNLPEYRVFDKLVFELQIRSLLQHTWAEIEHDLGYKTGTGVPDVIRRRFSMVAGLLEMADREFREIRNVLSEYESKVASQIEDQEIDMPLDRVSLTAFVRQSPAVAQLDKHLAELFGGARVSPVVDEDGSTVNFLAASGIRTVGQLRSEVELHRAQLARYEEIICNDHCELDEIESGLCLFHLAQILITVKKGPSALASLFAKFGYASTGTELLAANEAARAMKASGYRTIKLASNATSSRRHPHSPPKPRRRGNR